VVHCYFDDSGKESEPTNRFVVIAGYLAVDIVWDRLEHVWSHLLIKHGLSHVHMKDILGVAKAKGWDIPKLNSVLADFIRVPNPQRLHNLSTAAAASAISTSRGTIPLLRQNER
jgi:hypothetical protein